jgi:hypothetical protein
MPEDWRHSDVLSTAHDDAMILVYSIMAETCNVPSMRTRLAVVYKAVLHVQD